MTKGSIAKSETPAGESTISYTLISHHLCPYVQRAAIALAEKKAPFKRITIDLDAKPDWFKAISPLGKVPLLQVGRRGQAEEVLFESSAICEFIEETVPSPSLHPSDAVERAQHRAWMEFGSAILSDIYIVETTADPAVFDAKASALRSKFVRLEETIKGPYFAGDRFSLVDATFGPVFRYFDVFDELRLGLEVLTDLPKVAAWRLNLSNRASVADAVDADYGARLRTFLMAQPSHLRSLISSYAGDSKNAASVL